MKAAQINAYGGKEVVVIVDNAPVPTLAAGEVLVEVHAAGLNPFDYKVREGMARSMKELDFPATLGGDFAGVVSAIGEEVNGLEIGQAVYGQGGALSGNGSFAEFAPIKATSLASKPESVDFVTAAALPLASVSAYQALVDHAKLQSGQKVLIHGGAGGIGALAIQIAKNLGAYVATTVSADSIDFVKGLGADETIDYQSQDFADVIRDYDVVFDTVGGETNKKSYQVLKSGGALVSMVEQADEALAEQYKVTYTSQFTRVTPERLAEVTKLVDAGKLKVNVNKVFPLAEAAEALEYLKTSHPQGKVVLEIKA